MAKGKTIRVFAIIGALTVIGIASSLSQQGNAPSHLEVAELLDRIIQPRFQKDTRVFGITRVVKLVGGHARVDSSAGFEFAGRFRTTAPEEIPLLTGANAYKQDYLIAFLHTTHVPGKPFGPRAHTAV